MPRSRKTGRWATETLRREIAKVVDTLQAEHPKDRIAPTWVTNIITRRYENGLSTAEDAIDAADFHRFGTWQNTRQQVGDFLRRHFAANEDADENLDHQLVFPGFQYLQLHYIVRRRGEERDTAIPTRELSEQELTAVGTRLLRVSDAVRAHAMEVFRFRDDKFRPQPRGGGEENRVSI